MLLTSGGLRATEHWQQTRTNGSHRRVDPVGQARDAKFAVRRYVEEDSRWRDSGRSRLRWAHLVALPGSRVDEDFALPECPRWLVADRDQLDGLAACLSQALTRQETQNRPPDVDDVALLDDILRGRGLPQQDVVALAEERDALAEQLTHEQAVILGAISLLPRVEIRGGAGSGKTWLVLGAGPPAQPGRPACGADLLLARPGRGPPPYRPDLAPPAAAGVRGGVPQSRPAVGGGARARTTTPTTGSADYPRRCSGWRASCPTVCASTRSWSTSRRTSPRPGGPRCSPPLRDEETGGVYAFTDEGQVVFARYGRPPVPLVPIVLDHNMWNTRQIGEVFNPLTPVPMRLVGGDGPEVRFVECPPGDAIVRADDEVEALLNRHWRPRDVALLTTGSRHPEQVARQQPDDDGSQATYWRSFWDDDQIFYGHVLGFKGMERRAVVLSVNEAEPGPRSKERLYVGLSRARDELVVVGSADHIRVVGGERVLQRLRGE